jgi:uncharacterized protein (DUF433 family)
MTNLSDIIREPLYPISHAAHYVNVNPATLETWVNGRKYLTKSGQQYSQPLIPLEPNAGGLLSFTNLLEAHVLRAMRKVYYLKMPCIRESLDYVSKKLGNERPLATADFQTDGATLFINHLGELIDLANSKQTLLGEMIQHLTRIERNTEGLARKLYPMTRIASLDKKIIVINPIVSQGRPIIESRGVTTSIIADRWRAGDTFDILQKDYGLSNDEYDEALWYEQHEAA